MTVGGSTHCDNRRMHAICSVYVPSAYSQANVAARAESCSRRVDKSNRRFEMAMCTYGEPVHLVREPKHQADENAIAVVSARGIQLGYITSQRAAIIARWLDAGERYEALFQDRGRHHSGALRRWQALPAAGAGRSDHGLGRGGRRRF